MLREIDYEEKSQPKREEVCLESFREIKDSQELKGYIQNIRELEFSNLVDLIEDFHSSELVEIDYEQFTSVRHHAMKLLLEEIDELDGFLPKHIQKRFKNMKSELKEEMSKHAQDIQAINMVRILFYLSLFNSDPIHNILLIN